MTRKTRKQPDTNPSSGDEESFEPSPDGMSEGTARLAIDRHLKEKLVREHDIQSVENRGHYYVAKAASKDGSELYELLIDKQTGDVQIVNRRKAEGK